jgi:hypothetical protein
MQNKYFFFSLSYNLQPYRLRRIKNAGVVAMLKGGANCARRNGEPDPKIQAL